ncbi:tetratricopeptide repeat protein [Aquimarina agarilytica]|uniref:tetratricopeptide repeat protein n=1 Tax=Aquimarina agarilytica TaxID=1087449 RepID=UPI000288B5C7|nr:tetratricopeptide repeat protein [Aquimarina agarilytica]
MKVFFLALFFSISKLITATPESLEKGIDLFDKKQFEEAKEVFEAYLNEHPKNKVALEYLGDIAFQNKKWSTAANYFKPLLSIEKNNPRYHFKYAGAIGMKAKNNKLSALFLIDDIKEHFVKAAALDANYEAPRMALVQFLTELPTALGGSTEEATKYAKQLMLLNANEGKKALAYIEANK